MHPTLSKLLQQHFGDAGSVPSTLGPLVAAVDAAFYELELTRPTSHGNEGITDLMLESVPAIIYAAEFGPVAKCHYASPQIKAILGYSPEDWLKDPSFWYHRLHPEDRQAAIEAENSTQQSGRPLRVEYRMIARDGREVWIRDEAVVAHGDDGRPAMIHGLMYDITASKQAENKLLHEATHDALTGLPNRRLLVDRIDHDIARTRRESEYRFAVMCVGLDRFKVVNESVGPTGGDAMLKEFARRLQHCVRPADTVARIGGDEFVLLLEGVKDADLAHIIAKRVQDELSRPFDVNGMEVFVTSSMGIALNRGPEDTPQDLIRDADIAMHFAKKGGKAACKMFDADMHAAVVKQLQIENDLRRAIDRDEFEVHYQPICCLNTGHIESLEALVRWRHPERGMIAPMDFIPIAEETGLIAPIERIVLGKACAQVARWNEAFRPDDPISISVNLSAKRFIQHDLVDEILRIVTPTGLSTELLKLEITETVVMNNRDQAGQLLAELKRMNIRISMDDFGTGYSSLSYLHRFPIDTVKIDRSFVKMMDTPSEGDEIIRTIISLAHHLKMTVTAEGIETENQLNRLREMGCELGQGYYFAKPMDAAAFEARLAARSVKRAAA